MDRGLEIAETASQLSITPDTLVNWEQGHHHPTATQGAKVIKFLGYCPFEDPVTLGDHMRLWRWKRGFSHRKAAAEIGVDPSTWRSWERRSKRPSPSSLETLCLHGVTATAT